MLSMPVMAQDNIADNQTYPTIIPAPQILKKTGTGMVTRIIDPLRMELDNGKIIELSGLDIPDLYQREPGEISFAAKNLIEKLFLNKKVNIYQSQNQNAARVNRMGYDLAHITLFENNLWAQGALIANGLARVRTTLDMRELASDMYLLEQASWEYIPENDTPYIWRDSKYKVTMTDDLKTFSEDFYIIRGTIKQTAVKNNRIYLNFGDNWRNDFTVGIDSDARRLFSKEGFQPIDWANKTIRVRGWMRDYNGPYIEVDHPEQIEFIEPKKQESRAKEIAIPPRHKEIIKNALPDPEKFGSN